METIVRVADGIAAEIVHWSPVMLTDYVLDENRKPKIDDDGKQILVERQSVFEDHYAPEFVASCVVTDGPVDAGWVLQGDAFVPPAGLPIEQMRAEALREIDSAGASTRSRVIGPKETVYLAKAELAIRSMNGDGEATALLQLEAVERGVSVESMRETILSMRAVRLSQMMGMEAASARAKRMVAAAKDGKQVQAGVAEFAEAMGKIEG